MEHKVEITPEEQQFEKEATAEVNEVEIRAKIIEEFGFDETADVDKIDKLVAKDVESRKKLSKAIGQKVTYREQLKKGTQPPAPQPKSPENNVSKGELSAKDTIALVNAKVHDDDVDVVTDYAKFKGITVAEALKSSVVKTTLAENEEFRKTANASNAGGGKRVTSKITTESIVNNANEGKFPDKGSEEAVELFWARRGGRRS